MKGVIFFMSLLLVLVTAKHELCHRVAASGHCKGYTRMWAYSHYENMCVPFPYSGCGGNDNRFHTKEQCEKACA